MKPKPNKLLEISIGIGIEMGISAVKKKNPTIDDYSKSIHKHVMKAIRANFETEDNTKPIGFKDYGNSLTSADGSDDEY